MSRKEFIRFLGYSLRSCSEVQSQLYRAMDCQYINKEDFKEIYQMAGDCRGQIKAFRGYLRKMK
jgi:four helix bundle protein